MVQAGLLFISYTFHMFLKPDVFGAATQVYEQLLHYLVCFVFVRPLPSVLPAAKPSAVDRGSSRIPQHSLASHEVTSIHLMFYSAITSYSVYYSHWFAIVDCK